MDLSRSPYEQISRPKFGDLDHKKQLASQWQEWKKSIKLVHELFGKLESKKKQLGAESDDFRFFFKDINEKSADRAAMNVRNKLTGVTDRFTSAIILEAVRRFTDKHNNSDFSEVSDNGYMPWEEE